MKKGYKGILSAVLLVTVASLSIAGSQQILAANGADDAIPSCQEAVPKADPARIQELVRACGESHPGYALEWRRCVIDNPTEWMFDDMVLVSTSGTNIPFVKLYETPADEISRMQLQYKQRNDFNHLTAVNLEIGAEDRESLKASLMQNPHAQCPANYGPDGGITICEQTCDDVDGGEGSAEHCEPMRIDCLPQNDCICLMRE